MPITLLDIILLAVMFISGLLAIIRGFMREILETAQSAGDDEQDGEITERAQ